MATWLVSLVTLTTLAATPWEPRLLATWEGEMTAERADDQVGVKQIALTVLVADADADSATFLWTVAEKGRGAFPWTGRFGAWRIASDGRTIRGAGPAALFDHGEGLGEAPLQLAFAAPGATLKEDAAWTQGRREFAVIGEGTRQDRAAWRVAVRGPHGPQGELWLDRQTSFPLAIAERLTLGRGKPYEIQLRITKQEGISQERLETCKTMFEQWESLRNDLQVEPHTRETAWSAEQLAQLQERLPALVAGAAETPLAGVAAAAEEDLRLHNGRSGRLAALRSKVLNRPAPRFELAGLRGEKVANGDLQGAVALLHFWEYRDAPLEEPYGQVGYLDFLYRQRKEGGLKVYGVAVDERFADPAARSQAVSSARKLQAFMNLSYPLLADDGTMLKRFGDPRAAGGKLPLFIVLGADGNVLHYHAGFHDVDRDRGLKALDDVAAQALKSVR